MGERLSITRVKQEASFEMKQEHDHDFYEFYYLISGKRKFFLDNKVYRLGPGDLMVIPKGEIHRTTYFPEDVSEENGELYEQERVVLGFDDSVIELLRAEIGDESFLNCFANRQITIPNKRRAYLEELFDKMLHEIQGNDDLSRTLCKLYCAEIILFIIRCQRYQEPEATPIGIEDKQMEKAAQYMSTHFADSLTLKEMARKCCMSESYFSRRFKQVTGFGFKEYLNAIRIRHACDLLLTSNMNITEIAEECGFMDSNYFGDAFRKAKNMSPSKYRRAHLV